MNGIFSGRSSRYVIRNPKYFPSESILSLCTWHTKKMEHPDTILEKSSYHRKKIHAKSSRTLLLKNRFFRSKKIVWVHDSYHSYSEWAWVHSQDIDSGGGRDGSSNTHFTIIVVYTSWCMHTLLFWLWPIERFWNIFRMATLNIYTVLPFFFLSYRRDPLSNL